MICRNCETDNLNDMIYCKKCGLKIKKQKNKISENLTLNTTEINNIHIFTLIAYNIYTSKKKYINIFVTLSILIVSISIFSISVAYLPDALNKAVDSVYFEIKNEYEIQLLWRNFWVEIIFFLGSLFFIITVSIILFKMLKIKKVLKDNNIEL